MKKFLQAAYKVAILGALVLGTGALIKDANAQASQVPVFARQSTTPLLNVAAGAVINSGTLQLGNVNECVIYADNSAGGSARTLNINFLGPDNSTIVYQQAVTVAIATREMVTVSNLAGTASLPTGFVTIPVKTGPVMSFQLAAAGAAAGSLAWYCR